MGLIRRRGGGMFAPWIAHVFTDVVIAGIVLFLARPERPNQAMQGTAGIFGKQELRFMKDETTAKLSPASGRWFCSRYM
jgi:hypothetical protein